jgi:hypothetical protein
MTPFESYLALLRFHLNRSRQVWLFILFFSLQLIFINVMFAWINREAGGGAGLNYGGSFSVFFSVFMAFYFVNSMARTTTSGWAWILPNAEFLFIKPIHRPHIYLTLLGLIAIILIAAPCLNLVMAAFHPDLILTLYSNSDAARDLGGYQQAFPSSSIRHLRYVGHPSLFIPGGSLTMAAWCLWQTIFLGTLLEALSLIRRPENLPRVLYFVPSALILAGVFFRDWIEKTFDFQKIFLFFGEHGVLMGTFLVIWVALVQCAVWKRIEEIEVI